MPEVSRPSAELQQDPLALCGLGDSKSIRVVVRAKPTNAGQHSTLQLGEGQVTVAVSNINNNTANNPSQHTTRSFEFDAVLGPNSSQEDVYTAVGMEDMVRAAVSGYHATVFAYGHTGSGKTYTMEGYNYVCNATSGKQSNHIFQQVPQTSSQSNPLPWADFEGTPMNQLGLVPRAVNALFRIVQLTSSSRRVSVKVSFAQLYKEQAYDLLNATSSITAQTTGMPNAWGARTSALQNPARKGKAAAQPLRMRWNKNEEFYLENLFKVECSCAADVMSAYRTGIQAKTMAGHQFNAASSRSHALLMLQIDSHPLSAPDEITSSKLTLVDLAGSERSSAIDPTQGILHDESVAINKSLFTLRKVIAALAGQPAADAQQLSAGSSRAVKQVTHIPYRDSKLTALLKQSLGGSSVTTMIACISCDAAATEDNISTLTYAALAKRVVNQVAMNDDPKTRLIRELRAEVAFLRAQLAAAAPCNVIDLQSNSQLGLQSDSLLGINADQLLPAAVAGGNLTHNSTAQQSRDHAASSVPATTDHQQGPALASMCMGNGNTSDEQLRTQLLKAAEKDVAVLVDRLITCSTVITKISDAHAQLRVAYQGIAEKAESLEAHSNSLMSENTELRDTLDWLGISQQPRSSSNKDEVRHGGAAAAAAAMLELQELRQENALLHMLLQNNQAKLDNVQSHTYPPMVASSPKQRPSTSSSRGLPSPGSLRNSAPNNTGLRRAKGSVEHLNCKSSVPKSGPLSGTNMLSVSDLRALLQNAKKNGVSKDFQELSTPSTPSGMHSFVAQIPQLSMTTHQLAAQTVIGAARVTTTGQILPSAVVVSPSAEALHSPVTRISSSLILAADTADVGNVDDETLTTEALSNDTAVRLMQLLAAKASQGRARFG